MATIKTTKPAKGPEHVIKRGSVKQRALLYMEAGYERKHPGSGIQLTDEDFISLAETFQTESAFKVFSKYRNLLGTVVNISDYLRQLTFQLNIEMVQLNGMVLLWHAYKKEEALLNSIIEEVKDTKAREAIIKKILSSPFVLGTVDFLESGAILINTGSPTGQPQTLSIRQIVELWSGKASKTIVTIKSIIEAIRAAFRDLDISVTSNEESLNGYEEEDKKNWAVLPEYLKTKIGELGSLPGDVKDTKKDLFIYYDYDKVKIDAREFSINRDSLKFSFDDKAE